MPALVFSREGGGWRCGDYIIEPVDASAPKHRRRYRLRRGATVLSITVTVRMARLRASEDAAQARPER